MYTYVCHVCICIYIYIYNDIEVPHIVYEERIIEVPEIKQKEQ